MNTINYLKNGLKTLINNIENETKIKDIIYICDNLKEGEIKNKVYIILTNYLTEKQIERSLNN